MMDKIQKILSNGYSVEFYKAHNAFYCLIKDGIITVSDESGGDAEEALEFAYDLFLEEIES